jgi:predicted tellurium resistance membrane protein TerC
MRTSLLLHFCSYLENTSVSLAIQRNAWVIPSVQTIHIMAIAAVLIASLMIDLRLLRLSGNEFSIASMMARYTYIIWLAIPILLVTGIVMIIAEPARSLANPAFQLKMLMLIIVISITYWLQHVSNQNSFFWNASPNKRRLASILALCSIALWIGIVSCGRWIAYT